MLDRISAIKKYMITHGNKFSNELIENNDIKARLM